MEPFKSLNDIKAEKKLSRPKHIPEAFYSWICWRIYSLEWAGGIQKEEETSLEFERVNPSKYELNYLRALISGDVNLKNFYSENINKLDFFLDVAESFSALAHFEADYKTSCTQDSKIANKLGKSLEEACVQLQSSPDIRTNVQLWFENIIREFLKKNTGTGKLYSNLSESSNWNIMDLSSILLQLSDLLSKNQEALELKKYSMVKLRGKSVGTVYVAHKLKENMEKHSVPKRSHARLITDLIQALIDEEFSEDKLRKYFRQKWEQGTFSAIKK